jgi:hypothetical protein
MTMPVQHNTRKILATVPCRCNTGKMCSYSTWLAQHGQDFSYSTMPVFRRPASGYCLCSGCHLGRRPLPVTAACNGRPLSVTAADIAAARFL